jgi:C4-dicarboxylate-specific signal transduction histidine kinase
VIALVIIQIGLVVGADFRFGADPGLTALQVLMIALAITGLIVGAIVSEREIAALRLREQQDALNRAFRLRSAGEIAATIAHEINQPLTAVTTYSGIAAQAMAQQNWDLAATTVGKIQAESARANVVLKSIRDLLHQGALSKTNVDLLAALTNLVGVVVDDFTAKGLNITVSVPTDFPEVIVDDTQLQQAVHNLIINAAEAIFASGIGRNIKIRVSSADPHFFTISVIDDGPGFPPGVDTRDPAPFVTTKPEGSGLGLIVARSIAEGHGGNLAVRSTSRGAQVDIRFPLNRGSTI